MPAAAVIMAKLNQARAYAQKVKAAEKAKKEKSALMAKAESIERLAKKLKQLKRIGWLIKAVTLTGAGLGDVIISLWVLLFWANIEMIVFPLIITWWKQEWWEKMFTIVLDLIVLTICLVGISILTLLFVNLNDSGQQANGVNAIDFAAEHH